MSKKIVIVGGVAGGASAAARLRRQNEEDTIIVLEKGSHISFSNCSLPYYLSGMVDSTDKLILMHPEKFLKMYNVEARVNSEVVSIDRQSKMVHVKNVLTEDCYTESYDKLILSPGAKPSILSIPGIEKANVFSVRNVVDIYKLNRCVQSIDVHNIAVIGGGFIGVEVAENFNKAGFNVSLIEAEAQIMKSFDYDMVQILHKELYDKGVNLMVGEKVVAFENKTLMLQSGKKIKSDVVVMATGIIPETGLAVDAGLDLGVTGAIKTDQNYRTNDFDIYAVGDAIEVYHTLTQSPLRLSLAGPAQKQARGVADHINGKRILNKGVIGSSIIKVFDYNAAATGMNEAMIKAHNMNLQYDIVKIIPKDKVGIMPESENIHFKLLFEVPTGRVLGAQAIGKGNVDKRIDVIATAIKLGATIDHLRDLELCYAPPFGTAKDVINYAGYVASNLLDGSFKQVHDRFVRSLLKSNAYIMDVREKNEYEQGHVMGAINIPLSELRDRLDEIPIDKSLYIYCRSGVRSYNTVLALQHLGFKNLYNVSGGFLGISFFEYFNDQTNRQNAIVTAYNFE